MKTICMILGAVICILIILTGCLVQPTNPADVSVYNNQLLGIITPLITPLTGLLTVLVLWIKANIDKKDLKQTAEITAAGVAQKTTAVAQQLAEKADVAREVVVAKIDATHAMSAEALKAANGVNDKILKLQETGAVRAHSRATDSHDTPT